MMAIISSGSVTLKPTPYAERLMAQQYYIRGRNFLAAAILLDQRDGDDYVVLHLLCQGIELMAKGLLLLRDFAKYQSILRSSFGHNLVLLVSDALAEFKLNSL